MSERSDIHSFAVALCGRWEPQRLFALMTSIELKAFADESGTHDSRLTVISGWLGYADRCAEFEPKWKSVLALNGLPYIHAIDLRQGKKAFKDRIKWPWPKRLNLSNEITQLIENHCLCTLSVILQNSDYNSAYIGDNLGIRKHRDATASKYAVCARVFLSMLSQLVECYAGADGQATVVFEAGARGQNAVQTILAEMYDVAPDRARFINPTIGFALKSQSPGVQGADCLAYAVYFQEREGIVDVSALEEGFPESLPHAANPTHLRAPVTTEMLSDIRSGQIVMGGLRRRFGRHWSQLDGLPKGWAVQPLESGGFVLMPPPPAESPQPEDGSPREAREPIGFVHLECE